MLLNNQFLKSIVLFKTLKYYLWFFPYHSTFLIRSYAPTRLDEIFQDPWGPHYASLHDDAPSPSEGQIPRYTDTPLKGACQNQIGPLFCVKVDLCYHHCVITVFPLQAGNPWMQKSQKLSQQLICAPLPLPFLAPSCLRRRSSFSFSRSSFFRAWSWKRFTAVKLAASTFKISRNPSVGTSRLYKIEYLITKIHQWYNDQAKVSIKWSGFRPPISDSLVHLKVF